jgi:hypothetical protein
VRDLKLLAAIYESIQNGGKTVRTG